MYPAANIEITINHLNFEIDSVSNAVLKALCNLLKSASIFPLRYDRIG
jgi:hypothetical protein